MAHIRINDFAMNYEVTENLLLQDTLFIHGNLGSNNWWVKTREELKNRSEFSKNHRMVAAEWRGCGKTDAPKRREDLLVEKLADDYIQLVQELKLNRPVLVGHSTGGAIATVMAAHHPDAFSRLVLLDPVAADGVKFTPEMIAGFDLMRKDRAICEMVMATTIHHCDLKDSLFQQLVDDAMNVAPLISTDIPEVLKHGVLDFSEQAGAVSIPVTIIHGKEDVVLPIGGSRELAKLFKQSQLVEVENHGHSLNIENPELFVDLILAKALNSTIDQVNERLCRTR